MKNNILKGLLSLVFLAVALPVISQDFMNIFFKDGNSRKFYLNEIIEFKASNIDADGIQHDSYCYQYIKTATNEYIYSLEDVDSISFAKRDEALEEENFVNAMTSVFPIINECSDINDVESHLDAIKTAEGVEHAWTDGHQLYVEIEDGEIISFHFDHNELIDETSIEGMTSEIKALAPKLSHIVKPDGSCLKFAIANQQDKDESRNGQKGSYFLPLVQALTGCGIDVDYIPEPSVEFFYNNSDNPSDHLNFYDYDAVLFSTHGSYSEPFIYDFWFGDSFGPKVHSVSISDDLFLEEYEADSIVPNWHDNYKKFKKWRKQLNLSDVTDHHINYSFNKEKRDGKLYWVAHPNLTELFFRDIALGKFENPSSIFFNCACQSLMENDSFAEELMNNHGLGVYAGYTESNYFGQLSGYTLFSKLFSTLSLERAYQDLPSYMRHESLANINISGDFDIDSKMYYREKGVSDARLKILPENSLIIDELFILPVYTNFTTQEIITNEYNKSKTVKLSGTLTCLTQVKDVKLGFLYGTSSIPTQEVEATSVVKIFNLGQGNIEFSVELPNLERGKTYSYRAFTNDGFHYNYGDIYSFTIPNDLQLSSDKITLTIGETSTIQIISGSGDYGITGLDDASSIATVTLQGTTITINPIQAGNAIYVVTDMQTGKQIVLSITINKPDPTTIAEAVNLGLPSGTLWADRNVGATKPEEAGEYYSWGEIVYKPDNCTVSTYSLCTDGDKNTCQSLGNIAGTEYDVAHVKWGGDWTMPNTEQAKELLEYCTFEWVKKNSVSGFNVTGLNGNTIFIPAAGCRHGGVTQNGGVGIDLWLSEESNTYYGYYSKEITSNHYGSHPTISEFGLRYFGLYVRPVITSNTNPLNLELSNIVLTIGESITFEVTSGNGDYGISYIDNTNNIIDVTINGTKVTVNAENPGNAKFAVTDNSGRMALVSVTVNEDTDGQYSHEKETLIKLFKDTNGNFWTHKDNWCLDKSLDQWYGIRLNDSGNVQYIELANNNLSGSIVIRDFPNLYNISLAGNNLYSVMIDNCPSLDLGYGFDGLNNITLDYLSINNCLNGGGQHFLENANIKTIEFTNLTNCGRIFLHGVTAEKVIIRNCEFPSQTIGIDEENGTSVDTLLIEDSKVGDLLGPDANHLIIRNSTIEDWWLIGAKQSITLDNVTISGHTFNITGTPEEVYNHVHQFIN